MSNELYPSIRRENTTVESIGIEERVQASGQRYFYPIVNLGRYRWVDKGWWRKPVWTRVDTDKKGIQSAYIYGRGGERPDYHLSDQLASYQTYEKAKEALDGYEQQLAQRFAHIDMTKIVEVKFEQLWP